MENSNITGGQQSQAWAGDPQGNPHNQTVCSNCGHCPYCGRGGYSFTPYQPGWYPWVYPITCNSVSTADQPDYMNKLKAVFMVSESA